MLGRCTTAWAVAAMLAVAATTRLAAAEFLTTIEDLPLMPGLAEDKAAGIAFDKPGGRIVEAYALGAVQREAVLRFYAETLPALGWQTLAAQAQGKRWQREDEELELDILDGGPPLVVRFYLKPN